MTDRLAEIRGRLERATPGPWSWLPWHIVEGNPQVRAKDKKGAEYLMCEVSSDTDAALIAHAPADLAFLLGEVERLQGEVANLARVNAQQSEIFHANQWRSLNECRERAERALAEARAGVAALFSRYREQDAVIVGQIGQQIASLFPTPPSSGQTPK